MPEYIIYSLDQQESIDLGSHVESLSVPAEKHNDGMNEVPSSLIHRQHPGMHADQVTSSTLQSALLTTRHIMVANPSKMAFSCPRTEPCYVCAKILREKDPRRSLSIARKSSARSKQRCLFCNHVLCIVHAPERCNRR